MPPKRKSTGPRPVSSRQSSQQPQLSFHGKQNRVTKPSAAQQTKASKKDPARQNELAQKDAKTEAEPEDEPTTADIVIEQQAEEELQDAHPDPLQHSATVKAEDVLGGRAAQSEVGATGGAIGTGWVADEEEQARKISETQIKRYWREKESVRLAPRVHQEGLSVHEKVLREFDMTGHYGPCIGIARLKRWKRANVLGLKPPIEVLAVMLKEMEEGNAKAQRAHVDELMSSRFIET
ncbi:hypothetical protein BAUCODRAFT_39079 [Baudoinia panamericana UAMH 10762]|uniref:DNA polymerase delta subunit 4 n=1 Tax=Baudoinia panamericana (strain UAMH 10762) TaxID=717646 RepID=M2M5M5_BAUPA|nr:uncharacterized protein BAUCODRAFT_39079 [Baudoinia panamericana UAMH 10762]EMC91936.1 hypothetical protein BAUCODRAFT_39079 [Baudoinia panamericana UAMH 10762]